jgi:hypothetical protein
MSNSDLDAQVRSDFRESTTLSVSDLMARFIL